MTAYIGSDHVSAVIACRITILTLPTESKLRRPPFGFVSKSAHAIWSGHEFGSILHWMPESKLSLTLAGT